jgi:DNA-binding NtrC family response regulator
MQDIGRPVILLVDDERSILDGLTLALRREPYVILTATSGILALEILATRHVDIIVSDERMPGMYGSEFLQQVRRRWPRIVRILLTGETDLATMTSAIRVGQVYRFLSKPLGAGDLARTLHQAIDMQHTIESRQSLPPG